MKPPAETVEQLRTERDAARMLAEVRGREVTRLKALHADVWNDLEAIRLGLLEQSK